MRPIDIVHCPKCKGPLMGQGVPGPTGEPVGYSCPACGVTYSVVDAIADFLPGGIAAKGRGQKLMESPFIVDIYESRWWRDNGLFAWFTGLTLSEEIAMVDRIASPGETDTILDLACGTGIYTRAFAMGGAGRRVFGLDASWPMLRYAMDKARRMGLKNVRFLHGDAHSLPFADGSLDAANCCGALHLFPDVPWVLRELHRTLRPGGRFSIAVALRSETFRSRILRRIDRNPRDIRFFSKEELGRLLDGAGFSPAIYHAQGAWMIAGGIRR